jgi:hypothetical protein
MFNSGKRMDPNRQRQPRRATSNTASKSTLRNAAHAADNAGAGLFRWMTTDHANTAMRISLIARPDKGFWAHIRYILKCIFVPIGFALARTLLIIVLYAIWIPLMLWLLFRFLGH